MSKTDKIFLSGQASWYLTGLKKSTICYKNTTEPIAMQELVDNGLVALVPSKFSGAPWGDYYKITQEGRDYVI